MPTYKCTKCGREVELPRGTYSCEECGIGANMVEVCSTSTMRFPKFPPAVSASETGKLEEVRVFIDPLYLAVIDELVEKGYGKNQSDVIRRIVREWTDEFVPPKQGTPPEAP